MHLFYINCSFCYKSIFLGDVFDIAWFFSMFWILLLSKKHSLQICVILIQSDALNIYIVCFYGFFFWINYYCLFNNMSRKYQADKWKNKKNKNRQKTLLQITCRKLRLFIKSSIKNTCTIYWKVAVLRSKFNAIYLSFHCSKWGSGLR